MVENDGLALKLFKEQCCDNCGCSEELPKESIEDYLNRLKNTVSSFTQHDFAGE